MEIASVAFLFFDLFLNLFAQGARNFYRTHPFANIPYTVFVLWYLIDLVVVIHYPGIPIWSQG
jgi:hypothetical protein